MVMIMPYFGFEPLLQSKVHHEITQSVAWVPEFPNPSPPLPPRQEKSKSDYVLIATGMNHHTVKKKKYNCNL